MAVTEGTWKAIDALVKILAAGGITAAITLYGMKVEESQQKIAEKNRQVSALLEFTSKQKDLDVNLRVRMFETLMGHYFVRGETATPGRIREKMLLLRLVALNFQDLPLVLAPLFEQLDNQMTDAKSKEELRVIAREVARRQAFRLTFQDGFDSGEIKVKTGDEVSFENLPFTLAVKQVEKDQVKAQFVFDGRTIGPFTATYFDMPLTDNVKIGDMRVALSLLSSMGTEAVVRLVTFPGDLAEDRFDVKELSRGLRQRSFD